MVFVTKLAADYRMRFRKDVVIDIVCYRRRGHNEAEEPMKTQPQMYSRIRALPTTRERYVEKLIEEDVVSEVEATEMVEQYRNTLESGGHVALSIVHEPDQGLFRELAFRSSATAGPRRPTHGCPSGASSSLAERLTVLPDGFELQRQVAKALRERDEMTRGERPVNWGYAEVMAYATLVDAGHGVRLTGQDVGVGTFSHRHACLYNQNGGKRFIPLNHLSETTNFRHLRFTALRGGGAGLRVRLRHHHPPRTDRLGGAVRRFCQRCASGDRPVHLIRRNQVGAPVRADHVAGPTAMRAAGPEHSSARLERYLQLCAEHNMQVCIPSTPAQVFHMLRRQAIRPLRKPLVALTPKSLLRHKQAVSALEELYDGQFHTVLPEVDDHDSAKVTRLVLVQRQGLLRVAGSPPQRPSGATWPSCASNSSIPIQRMILPRWSPLIKISRRWSGARRSR